MDCWEFLIRLIEAIAWPAAIVFVLLSFRSELRRLLPLMRRLKAGPIEAEFEREILDVKQEFEQIPFETFDPDEDADSNKKLIELANISPRSAILESWINLESALRQAVLQKAGSPIPDMSSPLRLVKAVEQLNLVSSIEVDLLNDLRGLRNQAVHFSDSGLSSSAAINYGESAKKLEARFRKLAKHEH